MIVSQMEQITTHPPNDLLLFARVVAEGSFTAAADKLGLPKSTVSRRLSRLEQRLGERLLLCTTVVSTSPSSVPPCSTTHASSSRGRAVAALAESRQARGQAGQLRVSMPSDFVTLCSPTCSPPSPRCIPR